MTTDKDIEQAYNDACHLSARTETRVSFEHNRLVYTVSPHRLGKENARLKASYERLLADRAKVDEDRVKLIEECEALEAKLEDAEREIASLMGEVIEYRERSGDRDSKEYLQYKIEQWQACYAALFNQLVWLKMLAEEREASLKTKLERAREFAEKIAVGNYDNPGKEAQQLLTELEE